MYELKKLKGIYE